MLGSPHPIPVDALDLRVIHTQPLPCRVPVLPNEGDKAAAGHKGIGDRVGDGVGPRVILGENRDIPGELKAVTRQRVPMCLDSGGGKKIPGDGEVLFHAVIVGGHALRRGPQHELDDAGDLLVDHRPPPLLLEICEVTVEPILEFGVQQLRVHLFDDP